MGLSLTVSKFFFPIDQSMELAKSVHGFSGNCKWVEGTGLFYCRVLLYRATLCLKAIHKGKADFTKGMRKDYKRTLEQLLIEIDEKTQGIKDETWYSVRTRYNSVCIRSNFRNMRVRVKACSLELADSIQKLIEQGSGPECDELVARSIYVLSKWRVNQSCHDLSDIENLKKADGRFQALGLDFALSKVMLLFAVIYKNNEDKTSGYLEKAKALTQKIGNKFISRKIQVFEENYTQEMRKQYRNKFVCLSARPGVTAPVIQAKTRVRTNTDYIDYLKTNDQKFTLNTGKNLHNVLYQGLSETGKEVILQYEIFDEQSLRQFFQKKHGCRLLVLDIEADIPEGFLVMEKEGMQAQKVPLETIEGFIKEGPYKDNLHIDILVI